jgi:thioredoxin-dependent peroxiredoxin
MNKAPEFVLANHKEENVSLSSLKGNWTVLYFYPKDNTPGCTTEACEFSSLNTEFQTLNTLIYGISPDSFASHKQFISSQNLTIDLLSDPSKTTIRAYGAWGEKKNYGKVYEGLIRSTFIINPAGDIAASWKNVRAKGHAAKVLEKLKELQNE